MQKKELLTKIYLYWAGKCIKDNQKASFTICCVDRVAALGCTYEFSVSIHEKIVHCNIRYDLVLCWIVQWIVSKFSFSGFPFKFWQILTMLLKWLKQSLPIFFSIIISCTARYPISKWCFLSDNLTHLVRI